MVSPRNAGAVPLLVEGERLGHSSETGQHILGHTDTRHTQTLSLSEVDETETRHSTLSNYNICGSGVFVRLYDCERTEKETRCMKP